MTRPRALALCLLILAAPPALSETDIRDERLEQRLERELRELGADFIGHEAIAVPEDGHPKKYLLLDFEQHDNNRHSERQKRIHSICMEILRNRGLVKSLSEEGVHMVSVAFDQRHQYDCL